MIIKWFTVIYSLHHSQIDNLEVFIVVKKMCLVTFVHLLAGLLHILSQTGRTTAEHANLLHLQARVERTAHKLRTWGWYDCHIDLIQWLINLKIKMTSLTGITDIYWKSKSLMVNLQGRQTNWLLTSGWTSCSELRNAIKGGRPKCVTDRRPVNRLLFHTFWKWRSQTYLERESDITNHEFRADKLLSVMSQYWQ